MSDREKRRILVLLSGVVVLLIALMVYLTYFMIFEGETYRSSSQNRRNTIESANILRGSFYDRDNQVLAQTIINEDGKKIRTYSYPHLYSHVIGYTFPDLGKSGLELTMDEYLTNRHSLGIEEAIKKYFERESTGHSIRLSIDTQVQLKSSELLGDNKGAIVALNPKTGEVYSMVSKPNFNPVNLRENWKEINESGESPLFNRAINGLYPPGSVMKVISTASILEEKIPLDYTHTGTQVIDGYEYKDATSRQYGEIGLEEAFIRSLNTYFVDKIQKVGQSKFEQTASRFMFEETIPFELPISKSTLNFSSSTNKNQLSASSIGQGRVLSTPMEMALMASAIANNGTIMKPYLVSEIIKPDNTVFKTTEPEVLSQAISPELAEEINKLMIKTTNLGTGKSASIRNIQVSSKTGTAENETGKTHAWYVGFAPAEDPVVAVAVIVEQGGSGGEVAAPIGRDVIISVLNNISVIQ